MFRGILVLDAFDKEDLEHEDDPEVMDDPVMKIDLLVSLISPFIFTERNSTKYINNFAFHFVLLLF